MTSANLSSNQTMPALKVTLLLETLNSGHIAASIAEFPDCCVEATNRESAIALGNGDSFKLQSFQTAILSMALSV